MQHRQWQKEYAAKNPIIPTVTRDRPSHGLLRLEEYAKENLLPLKGPVLDLGCGNGRNSFYFARKGYKVFALDFIKPMLDIVRSQRVKNITVIEHGLPKRLPFKSNSIGIVLDMVSLASLNAKELKIMKREIFRILRPGGFFLTYCISDKNSYHAQLKTQKSEKFVMMPNGIRDRIWNTRDLVNFYENLTPQFTYVRHKKERVGNWYGPLEMVLALLSK